MRLQDFKNTDMKHKIALVVLMISSISVSSTFAESRPSTASLTLTAIVNEVVTLAITPKGDYSNLDVHNSQTDIPVATVYETSNSNKGYLVKARSENNSYIRNLNGNDGVHYSLKYGGGPAFSLSTNDQTLSEKTEGGVYNSAPKDVTISYQGVPQTYLSAGVYRDIITFTIESK